MIINREVLEEILGYSYVPWFLCFFLVSKWRLPIIVWWKISAISNDPNIEFQFQFKKDDNFKYRKRHVGSVYNRSYWCMGRIQSIYSLHAYWIKLCKLVEYDISIIEITRLPNNWLLLGCHSTLNGPYHCHQFWDIWGELFFIYLFAE